jgi:hypothetical protein
MVVSREHAHSESAQLWSAAASRRTPKSIPPSEQARDGLPNHHRVASKLVTEGGGKLPLSCRPTCWPGLPTSRNNREQARDGLPNHHRVASKLATESGGKPPLSCRPTCWPGLPTSRNNREQARDGLPNHHRVASKLATESGGKPPHSKAALQSRTPKLR